MKNLQTKTVRELVELARQWGLSGYSKLKKAELVKKLSRKLGKKPAAKASAKKTKKKTTTRKKAKPTRTTAKPAQKAATRTRAPKKTTHAKAAAPRKKTAMSPPLSALPAAYQDGSMVLVARDPHWLYAYWDLTGEQEQQLRRSTGPALRVSEITAKGPREIARIPLTLDARSWYLHVETAGRTYRAELGGLDRHGEFVAVIASNPSFTPSDVSADTQGQEQFATFVPGQPPVAAKSPVQPAGVAEVTERMYDLSKGTGLDSAEAQASWGQPSSHSLQGQGKKPDSDKVS